MTIIKYAVNPHGHVLCVNTSVGDWQNALTKLQIDKPIDRVDNDDVVNVWLFFKKHHLNKLAHECKRNNGLPITVNPLQARKIKQAEPIIANSMIYSIVRRAMIQDKQKRQKEQFERDMLMSMFNQESKNDK